MRSLPPGFRWISGPGGQAFTREETASWVRGVLDRGHTLYEAAQEAGEVRLQGRLPVPVVPVAGRPRVVRHYHRGGAVARVLGDRYLRTGVPRPLGELRASEEARARGIPTPRVVAGAIYPSGLVYRGDLVTDYVPRSKDLARILFGGEVDPPVPPAPALRATGRLLATMAAQGLRHPDVNARNVLLTADEEEPLAWILDLDRCALSPGGSAVEVEPMKSRLLRSLAKISETAGVRSPDPAPLEEGLAS